jgi:hypothetical protein
MAFALAASNRFELKPIAIITMATVKLIFMEFNVIVFSP